MKHDTKAIFKETLSKKLKEFHFNNFVIKPLKEGLKIFDKESEKHSGEIYFDYLRNAGGVYVGCGVFDGFVHQTLAKLDLTEKSNLLNASTLSFNSLSEKKKEFSNEMGGVIRIYEKMDIEETCDEIIVKIKKFHLKKIENLLEVNLNLADDIFEYPDHYSFPLPILAICLKKNRCLDWAPKITTFSKNKNLFKNKNLDFITKLQSIDF